MTETSRESRLRAEFEAMQAIRDVSTIMHFETTGDPPDHYVVTFRGSGLSRNATTDEIQEINEHRCEVRFTYSYPVSPPDIRWVTPIFHPNISFGGFIRLRDIGLPWEENLTLDVIFERLWDMARLAYVNTERVTNHTANNWLEEECDLALPVDTRPLRDAVTPATSNVVQYERREGKSLEFPSTPSSNDVLFIDDSTPVPPIRMRRRSNDDDNDILFIGDE